MIEDWHQLKALALGMDLPAITLATPWGHEALKAFGKMWCYWSYYEDAAVFKASRDEREMLMAAEPETFFLHPHYAPHNLVLVRAGRIDPGWARARLSQQWRDAAFAFLAVSRAALHVFFPILFPCLTLLMGERLVNARGLKIVQTVVGAVTRVLIVICIDLVFLAANLVLSGILTRMAMLAPGASVTAIAALSCDLFLKLAPFALYAVTLRESFQFNDDQSQTTENG